MLKVSRGTKNVGIDINYTEDVKNEDQYGKGKAFKPSKKVQKALVEKIKRDFSAFCEKHNFPILSIGVWSKPYKNTYYE